jgi:hypothetical protein
MEKDRGQGYVEGLERMLKGSQLSLKDAMAHFQEMCSKIIPEKNFPEDQRNPATARRKISAVLSAEPAARERGGGIWIPG